MKVYRGAPAAARNYVEADRCRADDYYLTEGTGVAQRLTADADGRVLELPGLSGDGYEAWVAGLDPDTGEPRGRVRTDGHAVRFVEVAVNGPKSWSLAAELHPEVAAAYGAAQDRAARAIVAWLGEHATTRVGPRGAQVAVPVERLEAAVVRHYTSRAGDPHRHLHLQVNARVFAAGKWRGLDTVAFRDSIAAINGIGHAAVACDPEFRTVLAGHGYTLNSEGEIAQLAPFVGAFSKRATQIGGLLERYEAEWRAAHPGREPGPRLRRAWDARAWAEDRPDKVVPRSGDQLRDRWVGELHQLGYRDPHQPTQLALPLPGAVDRDAAASEVIARLGAGRSAWNAADLRGEVEQLLARQGVVADPSVRGELAEDVTARALASCVPLTDGPVPEHVRALTSSQVLGVEADLTQRLAARGAAPHTPPHAAPDLTSTGLTPATVEKLDAGQAAAVAALIGDAPLVVVEGAAGTGKTTTLTATQNVLEGQGHRLLVVTPTRKAAQVAATQTGARAGSAAWLAWQHGWRWIEHGTWTRETANPNAEAQLRSGDLLLIDEAGMLDQDTARALLVIADETGARLALVGDRHQLPAVGRGGVLELAHRWVHPDARVDLDQVHRFVHVVNGVTVPDVEYAQLSLALRVGDDPAGVFDALHARGQVAVHGSEGERRDALADRVAESRAAGTATTVVVDTREHADDLNTAIRERLVAAGVVDNDRVAITDAGGRVGVGDVVVTRRNDTDLGVANREGWIVTAVRDDGGLALTNAKQQARKVPGKYVRQFVELGYASTAYGAQGDTTTEAHLVLTDKTTAAAAYVGLTRGRETNVAHLVAEDVDNARKQWITSMARGRADLGPGHAATRAAHATTSYRPAPEPTGAGELAAVLDQLRAAWAEQATAHAAARNLQRQLAITRAEADWWARCEPILTPLEQRLQTARGAAQHAERAAAGCADLLSDASDRHNVRLRQAWNADLTAASAAARLVEAGPGRLGLHRGRVRDAQAQLDAWADRWAPAFEGSDHDPAIMRQQPWCYQTWTESVGTALHRHAIRLAAAEHPHQVALLRAAEHAATARDAAATAYRDARRQLDDQSRFPTRDTGAAERLPALIDRAATADERAARADRHVQQLTGHPTVVSQPDPAAVLAAARKAWKQARDQDQGQRHAAAPATSRTLQHAPLTPSVDRSPGIGF